MNWALQAKPGDFGAFAPRVFEHAAGHDPIALEIALKAARAIGALTRGVVALGAERVALVGGVGEALRPYFEPDIAARLSAAAVRSDRWGDPVRWRRHRASKGSRAMKVLYGARIFDGERLHDDCALVVDGASIQALTRFEDRPRGGEQVDLGGGVLSPGFIDWQINGGGGVLFNANPTVEGIAAIAAAHRRAGVTAFLPTVVTDAPRVLDAALAAAREARERVPGALGIHVEGPFIDPKRKGVHPPEFIRPMLEEDADALIAARAGVMVVTLAPASVSLDFIARLAKAGIVVSLGHSDASAEEAVKRSSTPARAPSPISITQ